MSERVWKGDIAEALGLSRAWFSNVLSTKKRVSRISAVELEKISGVDRMIWLYGTQEEIRDALIKRYGYF